MATDLRTAKNGKASKRTKAGRFASGGGGGPGRPKGKPNRTTTDLRAVRDAIVASWSDVDGPALLRRLAKERPESYLRILTALLPKAHNIELGQTGPMFREVDIDFTRL